MSSKDDILVDAEDAKALLNNKSFKSAIEDVENGLKSAILNCRFDRDGDADKLVLSMQLFNKLISHIKRKIEFGEAERTNIANELLRERKAKEPAIFNRDVE